MRLPLPLVLLALAALATLARADEYTSIAQFGLTYLTSSGWSTTNCSASCCTMPACCNWPGVTFNPAPCAVTAVDLVAPVGYPGGDPFPTYIWDAALGSQLNVFSLKNFGFSTISTSNLIGTYYLTGTNTIFRLKGNSVSSAVPGSLTSMSLINNLDLSGNGFTGVMPSLFGQQTIFITVDLSNNAFTSADPFTWYDQSGTVVLLSATDVRINLNQIAGEVPYLPKGRSAMQYLDFSSNKFSLLNESYTFPGPNLWLFDLHDNKVLGPLPANPGCPKMQYWDLSRNLFYGSIPNWSMPSLQYLNLAQNGLNASIPNGPYGWAGANLVTLDLSLNQIPGPLPMIPDANTIKISTIRLSSNQFTGGIAGRMDFTQQTNLTVLALDVNKLSGPVPTEIGLQTNLIDLDLSTNQFTSLPLELSNLVHLERFWANNNNLTGNITMLAACTNLTVLDVSNNQLTGDLSWLLSHPKTFDLCDVRNNLFNYASCATHPCLGCPATAAPTTAPAATTPPPTTTTAPTQLPITTAPSNCTSTTNCPLPVPDYAGTGVFECCDGVYLITPTGQEAFVLDIPAGASVTWIGKWNHTPNDTLIVHFDPQNKRKRQSQEALLKVDGDASVNGPLQIVLDSPPDVTLQSPQPIVTVSGNLNGQFVEPIAVTTTYSTCAQGSAQQTPSTNGITALVSVDNKKCKGKGLSTNAKVAIGVVCGVVGLGLIVIALYFIMREVSPTTMQRIGLMRAPAVTGGSSTYSSR